MYHVRIKSLNYLSLLRVIAVLLVILIALVAFRPNNAPTTPPVLVESAKDAPKVKDADYTIVLEDDFIVVYDGSRVVGTLSYRTSLGRMMMKDNE